MAENFSQIISLIRNNSLPLHPLKEKKAMMAQLVEQRIRNAWVAGSSPARGSFL